MRLALMVFVMTYSVASVADFAKPLIKANLSCIGKMEGKQDISLSITAKARPALTTLVIREEGLPERVISNRVPLVIGSEGSVYIQQVSNDLGYNLKLAGPDLLKTLNKKKPQAVTTHGNIDLFKQNTVYMLICKGELH